MSATIVVKFEGHICQILFNRPEKKNAITAEMYQLMADAIKHAESNTTIKVIVLSSTSENFTAGNDLVDFLANPSIAEDSGVYQFLQALMHAQLPIIAAVEGFAVGIGSTLLLHCEQVFASVNAKFSFPFVNLGLVPEAGSTLLLPQQVGYKKAADLLMLGNAFTADEAHSMGFVSELVSNNVLSEAMSYAQQLAEKPRTSLIEIKRLLKRDVESLQSRADIELQSFVECLNSPAAKEAISAFLEKRKPDFSNL
jgi:enoyl-CoA hydratase/carnithine racemase